MMDRRALGAVILAGCGAAALAACTEDPCERYAGKTRAQVHRCFAGRGTWQAGGAHRVGDTVYSVEWLDHDPFDPTEDIWWLDPDICDDEGFTREIAVFAHGTANPGVLADTDRAVYGVRLRCSFKVHCDGGRDLLGQTVRQVSGAPPLPASAYQDCWPWPSNLERPAEEVRAEACYETGLCPVGTECFAVSLATECPPGGSICSTPAGVLPLRDLDGDGLENCEDPDLDGDGLGNDDETTGAVSGYVTDPYDPDTDDDGLLDGEDPLPSQAACQTVRYHEDFATDPANFVDVVGNWSYTPGSGALSSDSATGVAVTWDASAVVTNGTVILRLRPASDANAWAGLLLRVAAVSQLNDGGLAYFVGLNPGLDRVAFGLMDGAWHELGAGNASLFGGVAYDLAVTLDGSHFAIAVDGELLFEVTDTRIPEGALGLRTHNTPALFEDLLVCD